MTLTLVLILLIVFIASLFRSTLGFGESLVAVPLFLFFLPAGVAVPLSVLISITIALIIVIQDHSKIHIQSARWLIVYATLGLPLGILILTYANETFVKIVLGFLIIAYAGYSLLGKINLRLEYDHKTWLFICGFLSGVLGGAYGLNGPPLVVYGSLRQWTAKHFRATLQAYFFPVGVFTVLGYYFRGLITWEVGEYYFISLLAVIPAVFLGRYFNRKLKNDTYLKYAFISLVLIGFALILSSWLTA